MLCLMVICNRNYLKIFYKSFSVKSTFVIRSYLVFTLYSSASLCIDEINSTHENLSIYTQFATLPTYASSMKYKRVALSRAYARKAH